MKRIFGYWETDEQVASEFISYTGDEDRKAFFREATILIACYYAEFYEGDGYVLLKKGDELFELEGGHCSCYGMSDHWPPQPTTAEALKKRKSPLWRDSDPDVAEFKAAWTDLVKAL